MNDSNGHLYGSGYEDCKKEVLAILKAKILEGLARHDTFLSQKAKSKCHAINYALGEVEAEVAKLKL
jgi:hypothetical protein